MAKPWRKQISRPSADGTKLHTLTVEVHLDSFFTLRSNRMPPGGEPFAPLLEAAKAVPWCEELDRAIEGLVKDFFKT